MQDITTAEQMSDYPKWFTTQVGNVASLVGSLKSFLPSFSTITAATTAVLANEEEDIPLNRRPNRKRTHDESLRTDANKPSSASSDVDAPQSKQAKLSV